MNREQIFLDTVNKCTKELTLSFLTKEIVDDKTETLKKYMNSYGVFQLALHLQGLAKRLQPPKNLTVNLKGTYKRGSVLDTYAPNPPQEGDFYDPFALPKPKKKATNYYTGLINNSETDNNITFGYNNDAWTVDKVIATTNGTPNNNGDVGPAPPMPEMAEIEDGDLFDE